MTLTAAQPSGVRWPGTQEPYYLPVGNEIAVFETCHAKRLAVMLKGPTGCGKTRFVEHMAWRLGRPLVTVACHDDLSASDLTGRYLIRDRDAVYGSVVTRRLRAMGIRDKPISAGSPWQNGFAERLIGTIRRECVDHLIVLGEAHLRQVLIKFATYYNECRIHRALNKDAPFHRATERLGAITSRPVLGGLHHQYCRA